MHELEIRHSKARSTGVLRGTLIILSADSGCVFFRLGKASPSPLFELFAGEG